MCSATTTINYKLRNADTSAQKAYLHRLTVRGRPHHRWSNQAVSFRFALVLLLCWIETAACAENDLRPISSSLPSGWIHKSISTAPSVIAGVKQPTSFSAGIGTRADFMDRPHVRRETTFMRRQGRRALSIETGPLPTRDSYRLRVRIGDLKDKLRHNLAEQRLLFRERVYLEKTLRLMKEQRKVAEGHGSLSREELEEKERELKAFRQEAPRVASKYEHLIDKQKDLQDTLNRLHKEAEGLILAKNEMLERLQHLNMEDLIERHARGLPEAMAGALRKSAVVLTPFFDTLLVAADTNNRLVDHVGSEIDKYTHVNVGGSPFLSGLLFYCVMLVPALAILTIAKRMFDSSTKLSVSHLLLCGNLYLATISIVFSFGAVILREDPLALMQYRYEKTLIASNLLLALYFTWHFSMLALQVLHCLERRSLSQLLATSCVGIHYYLFAWRKVFTDAAPSMYAHTYMIYATIFCFITYDHCERIHLRRLFELTVIRRIRIFLGSVDFSHLLEKLRCVLRSVLRKIRAGRLAATKSRCFSPRASKNKIIFSHGYTRRPCVGSEDETVSSSGSVDDFEQQQPHASGSGFHDQGSYGKLKAKPSGFFSSWFWRPSASAEARRRESDEESACSDEDVFYESVEQKQVAKKTFWSDWGIWDNTVRSPSERRSPLRKEKLKTRIPERTFSRSRRDARVSSQHWWNWTTRP